MCIRTHPVGMGKAGQCKDYGPESTSQDREESRLCEAQS